jgi:hypothetical protein
MVAKRIEAVRIAPVDLVQAAAGAQLVIEDAVADFLCGLDLGLVAGQPHFQSAYTAQRADRACE